MDLLKLLNTAQAFKSNSKMEIHRKINFLLEQKMAAHSIVYAMWWSEYPADTRCDDGEIRV
jgi:stress-induced morphogen